MTSSPRARPSAWPTAWRPGPRDIATWTPSCVRSVVSSANSTSERRAWCASSAGRVPAGEEPDLAPGERLLAVDLDGRAPDEALARGETARAGLGQALLRAGAAKLAAISAAAPARPGTPASTAADRPASELETLVPD